MHWQDAVKASNIDRAKRSYDRNRTVVRFYDGSCYLYYSDTGKFIGEFLDRNRIEGLLDWLPVHQLIKRRRFYWLVRLIRWIKRRLSR